LKKHRIVSFADYIVGMPGDTIEHYEEARLFFIENTPDIIEPYWMTYHPKTEIIKKDSNMRFLMMKTGFNKSRIIIPTQLL